MNVVTLIGTLLPTSSCATLRPQARRERTAGGSRSIPFEAPLRRLIRALGDPRLPSVPEEAYSLGDEFF
jgi:hypothetical protein